MPTPNYGFPVPNGNDSFKAHRDFRLLADAIDTFLKTKNDEVAKKLDEQKYRLNVMEFGAVGDGVTNDIQAIQKTIDAAVSGTIIHFPFGKRFKIQSSILVNKSNLRFTGGGVILLDGLVTRGFQPVGTVENLEIDHLEIVGDGLVSSGQQGIGNLSGANVYNAKYHHLKVHDVVVGISLNANSGGNYESAHIYENNVYNIVGTEPGQGYGIHLAGTKYAKVYANRVDRVQRHSIYQGRGSDNDIYDNTVTNHRLIGNDNNGPRAAINVGRSQRINIYGNRVVDGYDCAFNVTGETDSLSLCEDVTIENNVISNPKNGVSAINIGEQMAQEATILTRGVKVKNNKIVKDATTGGSILTVLNGYDISLTGNEMKVINVNGGTNSGIAIGSPSFSLDSSDLDLVHVENNKFAFEGNNTTNARAISVLGPVCGANGIRLEIGRQEFTGLFTATGKAFLDVYFLATNTNPLLIDKRAKRSSYGISIPVSGYYERGDKILNTGPTELGGVGARYIIDSWTCITSGSPGVWKENRILTGS